MLRNIFKPIVGWTWTPTSQLVLYVVGLVHFIGVLLEYSNFYQIVVFLCFGFENLIGKIYSHLMGTTIPINCVF